MAFFPRFQPAFVMPDFLDPLDEEPYRLNIYHPLTWPIDTPSQHDENPAVLSLPQYYGPEVGLSDTVFLPTFDLPSWTGSSPASQLPSPPDSTAVTPCATGAASPAAFGTSSQHGNLPATRKRQRSPQPAPHYSRPREKVSVDPTSSDDEFTSKRKKNTAAARRYREKKGDREKQLEKALEEAMACNAELKTEVAVLKERLAGATDVNVALETAQAEAVRLRMEVEMWKIRAEIWSGQCRAGVYDTREWD